MTGTTPERRRVVLVTGGSGFIGTNLVDFARAQGIEVVTLDPRPPQDETHRTLWRAGDSTSTADLLGALRDTGATHLVHLAGETSQAGKSMADYAVNVDGTRAALAALAAYGGVRRAVFASSRLVCALGVVPTSDLDYCPPNFYARSKVIAEQLVRAHPGDLERVIVRPTAIWGPWGDEPYRPFFLSLARGRYLHPQGVRVLKHYGFVGNTVHQVLRLLEAPGEAVHGRTFYLADPEPTEVGAFAALIRRRMGLTPPREAPLAVLHAVARAGDVVERVTGRRAPLSSDRLANLRTPMLYDLDPIRALTGPPAFSLIEGIDQTIAHLRAQGDIPPAPRPTPP